MTTTAVRGWVVDAVIGIVCGAIVGAILAVNIAIYAGPDDGYQSSIADVFDHNIFAGFAIVLALVGAPGLGLFIARRSRRKRNRAG